MGALGLLPVVSVLPGSLLLFSLVDGSAEIGEVLWALALLSPLFAVLTILVFLGLTAGSVRFLARFLPPGSTPRTEPRPGPRG